MTKEEAIKGFETKKTAEEWLAFEKEYYETLSEKEREEIGTLSMPMVEWCGYIRYIQSRKNG